MRNVHGTTSISSIVWQSLRVLIWTALLSSIGGIALQGVQSMLLVLTPLLILFPALNDAIGSIGTVTSSRFTSILYLKGARKGIWKSREIKELFRDVGVTALLSALYIAIASLFIAYLQGYALSYGMFTKVLAVTLLTTLALFVLIFAVAIFGGLFVYRKGKDPDNFLIPITTSVADIGNMLLFSFLIRVLF